MTGPAEGKRIYGIVTVGERGQIVIPKEARDRYNIRPKDKLLILSPPLPHRKKGILVLIKAEEIRDFALSVLGAFRENDIETASKNP